MRVLVPVDGSTHSDDAVEYALDRHADDEIVLLNVLDFVESGYADPGDEMSGGWTTDWYERARESADELFAEYESTHGRGFETDVVVGRPARAIVEYAEDGDVDAIVMGSHGRVGVSRVLLGSVAEKVVRRAPVPVTVVR